MAPVTNLIKGCSFASEYKRVHHDLTVTVVSGVVFNSASQNVVTGPSSLQALALFVSTELERQITGIQETFLHSTVLVTSVDESYAA